MYGLRLHILITTKLGKLTVADIGCFRVLTPLLLLLLLLLPMLVPDCWPSPLPNQLMV